VLLLLAMARIESWTWHITALVIATAFACAPPPTGDIGPNGYQNRSYRYQVASLSNGNLMSADWKLDNYYVGKKKSLRPKEGDDYITEYSLDADGDGLFETKAKEYLYDLRFKHLVHDGVIFLRTIPVSADLERKKLSTLMDRFIEQIAGAGYEVVKLNPTTNVVVEKRYAAALVDKHRATLADTSALVVTLDIANLDQLKVDPAARKHRLQLVLLHTHFKYTPKSGVGKNARAKGTFPVVMLAGYANQPGDFSAGLNEFHDLLNRITISKHSGFRLAPVQ